MVVSVSRALILVHLYVIAANNEDLSMCLSSDSKLLYQSYNSLQHWIEATTNVKIGETQQHFVNELQQIVEKNKQENDKLKIEIESNKQENNKLREKIKEMEQMFSTFEDKLKQNGGSNYDAFRDQIRKDLTHQTQLIKQQASIIRDVSNDLSQCVTDIKVSKFEQSSLWKTGSKDEGNKGYFLSGLGQVECKTGVFNCGKEGNPVFRRSISFRRQNVWIPLHE